MYTEVFIKLFVFALCFIIGLLGRNLSASLVDENRIEKYFTAHIANGCLATLKTTVGPESITILFNLGNKLDNVGSKTLFKTTILN